MTESTALVRVPEELRFLLAPRHRGGAVTVPIDGVSTAIHLVESIGVPRTEVGALLIDGVPAPANVRPGSGAVIEIRPVERPQPVPAFRFVADVHLGSLARRLRLLGVDVAYRNDAADAELVACAAAEQRVVLTQDRGLLRRRALVAGAYVRGCNVAEQLADVLDRFAPPLTPWTRRVACNGELEPVAKEQIEHLLEPGTRRSYTDFTQCPACAHLYWRGAHAHRLSEIIATAGAAPPPHPTSSSGLSAARRRESR